MDAKVKTTLEKIRKSATSSLTAAKIEAALAELEGWSYERKVLTLRRCDDFRMSVGDMYKATFIYSSTEEGINELREQCLAKQVSAVTQNSDGTFEIPAELVENETYYANIGEVKHGSSRWYFDAQDWICVKADRAVAPNGHVFDNWYEPESRKRAARIHHNFWRWAFQHGIREAASQALGLPTVEEEKREREFYARDITNTGTCPCCGRNIKLDAQGRMVHHGYERPGDGMGIVGDCFGVGYEPFEVSPRGTMAVRDHLIRMRDSHVVDLGNLKGDKVDKLRVKAPYTLNGPEYMTIGRDHAEWEQAHRLAIETGKVAVERLAKDIEGLQTQIDAWEPDDLPEVKARARGWRPKEETIRE